MTNRITNESIQVC